MNKYLTIDIESYESVVASIFLIRSPHLCFKHINTVLKYVNNFFFNRIFFSLKIDTITKLFYIPEFNFG